MMLFLMKIVIILLGFYFYKILNCWCRRQKIASMDVSKTSMNVWCVMCINGSVTFQVCTVLVDYSFPKRINCIDSIDCDCGFKYLTAAEQFLCHDTSHVTRHTWPSWQFMSRYWSREAARRVCALLRQPEGAEERACCGRTSWWLK